MEGRVCKGCGGEDMGRMYIILRGVSTMRPRNIVFLVMFLYNCLAHFNRIGGLGIYSSVLDRVYHEGSPEGSPR